MKSLNQIMGLLIADCFSQTKVLEISLGNRLDTISSVVCLHFKVEGSSIMQIIDLCSAYFQVFYFYVVTGQSTITYFQ